MSPDWLQSAPGGEETHVSPSAVALTAFRLVSIVGFCLIVAACTDRHRGQNAARDPTLAPKGSSQNEVDDGAAIEEAWKEQDRIVREHLDGYGWIDRAAGVAHVPIDREIDLMLADPKISGPKSAQIEADDAQKSDTALQRTGRRLFRQYGCNVCHGRNAVIHAPSLVGIYGQRIRLSDGTFVRADDQYLHDMILYAGKRMVAGYTPMMPSYRSVIPEPDVLGLIAYLKSFSGATSDPSAAHSP